MIRRDQGFTVMEVLIVIVIIAIVAAIAIPGLISSQRSSYERNASTSLKTICVAEHDFRANDREGNRVNDFWTGDVKGLYTLTNAAITGNTGGTVDPPIRLIDLSLAAADTDGTVLPAGGENTPVTTFAVATAKAGYWYMAMEVDNNYTGPEASYKMDTLGNPNMGTVHHYTKFGVVAYPDSSVFGKYCFIVNEANTIYRSATTGPIRLGTSNPPGLTGVVSGYRNWPDDNPLKSYWSKLE
jgi:prepilin-type N-terminal cleavage/methylation domain-containing protein